MSICLSFFFSLWLSISFFNEQIEASSEVLLMAKTQASRLAALVTAVKAAHPYTVPEVSLRPQCLFLWWWYCVTRDQLFRLSLQIIATPVVGGLASYLQWVRDSTQPL